MKQPAGGTTTTHALVRPACRCVLAFIGAILSLSAPAVSHATATGPTSTAIQTFHDPAHGYSFNPPADWSALPEAEIAAYNAAVPPLQQALIHYEAGFASPNGFSRVVVAWVDRPLSLDDLRAEGDRIISQWRSGNSSLGSPGVKHEEPRVRVEREKCRLILSSVVRGTVNGPTRATTYVCLGDRGFVQLNFYDDPASPEADRADFDAVADSIVFSAGAGYHDPPTKHTGTGPVGMPPADGGFVSLSTPLLVLLLILVLGILALVLAASLRHRRR